VDDADINFVHLIVALAKQKKQRPCLIIDEANLCLNGGLNEDKIINQFLHFVKEDHQMSVILCTSKHSFPARLERSGVQHGFVKLVEAEEPPPYAVWKFLTKEKNFNGDCIIGMGRNLAKLERWATFSRMSQIHLWGIKSPKIGRRECHSSVAFASYL
jgi:hypothetical protein